MRTWSVVAAGVVAAAGAGWWAIPGSEPVPRDSPAGRLRARCADLPVSQPARLPETLSATDAPVSPGGGVLRGVALDPDGFPWRGLVGFYPGPGRKDMPDPVPVDVAGRFTLAGLPPDEVRLRAVLPGEREVVGPVVLLPAPEEVVFRVGAGQRRVEGVVLEGGSDRAVPGAQIEAEYPGERLSIPPGEESTRSDEAGRFRLRLPPRREVRIRATAPGFAPFREDFGTPAPGVPLAIRLLRPATITGRVLAEGTGLPVPGVRVGLRWDGARGGGTVAESDAAGRFELTGIPPGRHWVFAGGDGWAAQDPQWVDAVEGVALERDVPVAPAIRIRGRVLGPDGSGVAGVVVRLRDGEGEGYDTCRRLEGLRTLGQYERSTGPGGAFLFPALPPGADWELVALRDGVPQALAGPFRETGGAEIETDLAIPAPAGRVIRVVDAGSGAPLEGADVALEVERPWELGWKRRAGPTGSEGTVRFDVVPGIPFLARVASPALWASGAVEVRPDEPGPVTLRVPAVRRGDLAVEGRVVFADGTPVPDAGWMLRDAGEVRIEGSADALGRFRASRLVEGFHWTIHAEGGTDGTWGEGEVEARSGDRDVAVVLAAEEPMVECLEMREDPVRIRVRVLGPGGEPVPRARVQWRFDGPEKDGDSMWFSSDLHDGEAGIGVPQECAGGTVRAYVSEARDGEGRPFPFANAAAGPFPAAEREVEIRLLEERSVSGRVLDDAGRGVEGAEVECRPAGDSDPAIPESEAVTDADGLFRVGGLAGGTQVLRVAAAGAGCVNPPAIQVEAGATDVEVRVRRKVGAVVRVLDPGGRPVARAIVEADPEGAAGTRRIGCRRQGLSARTDSRGAAGLRDLDPERRYRVAVRPPPDREDLLPAGVASWYPADATIRLEPARSLVVRVLDSGGRPLSGARGSVTAEGAAIGFRTGNDGRARIGNLPPGPARVVLDHRPGEVVPVPAGRDEVVVRPGEGGESAPGSEEGAR